MGSFLWFSNLELREYCLSLMENYEDQKLVFYLLRNYYKGIKSVCRQKIRRGLGASISHHLEVRKMREDWQRSVIVTIKSGK